MPTLEGVEPSWIQDGWGIQGDQNEVRFDDDIPWDLIAWTRDHPDQSDFNCCKPTSCPSVTFSGVEYCCGCNQVYFDGVIGALNGVDFPLTSLGGECNICTNSCLSLELFPYWGQQTSGILIIGRQYLIASYATGDDFTNVGASSNTTGVLFTATGITPTTWTHGTVLHLYSLLGCTGSHGDAQSGVGISVGFFDGLWHIAAIDGSNNLIFFYGTTTDVGVPADNQVTDCTDSPTEWDLPECLGGTQNLCSQTAGGTATIGSSLPTGACVNDLSGDCTIKAQYDCEHCNPSDPSTYQGDGTPCADSYLGVCCFDGVCDDNGGSFYTETFCTELGGVFAGIDSVCDPNPC